METRIFGSDDRPSGGNSQFERKLQTARFHTLNKCKFTEELDKFGDFS